MALKNLILLFLAVNAINGGENVKNLRHYISTEKMEAEDYTAQAWTSNYNDCPDTGTYYVGSFDTSSILQYADVDFSSGVNRLLLHVANINAGGQAVVDIAFHLGGYNNPAFVTVPVNYTGTDRCGFVTLDVDLDPDVSPSGVQDLFLTFPSSTTLVLHLDWFYFNQTSTANFVATDKIEAEAFISEINCNLAHDCTDTSVQYIALLNNESLVVYDGVDFGSGVEMVTVNVANMYTSTVQYIHMQLDNTSTTPVVIIPVGQTGLITCSFYALDNFLAITISGVHHLYLTFSGPPSSELHLDWFQFK